MWFCIKKSGDIFDLNCSSDHDCPLGLRGCNLPKNNIINYKYPGIYGSLEARKTRHNELVKYILSDK